MATLLDVPTILKHVVVALLGGKRQVTKAEFMKALKIARSRLEEYKFLRPGSRTGPITNVRLAAGKAPTREKKHRNEGAEGRRKTMLFDRWAKMLLTDLMLEDDEAPSQGKADPVDKTDRGKPKR